MISLRILTNCMSLIRILVFVIPSINYTSLKSYSALDHGRLTTKNTVNQKELDQEFALVGGDLSIE